MKKIFFLFILYFFFNPNIFAQEGWFWQNPLPQGNYLNDVQCLDSNIYTAVGDFGTILRTTNGGVTWENLRSGITDNFLSVFFVNKDSGIVIGTNGIILQTCDGGTSWINRSFNTTEIFTKVRFINASIGMIVGFPAFGGTSSILRTTDGGETWNRQQSGLLDCALYDVYFSSPEIGIVVGELGKILWTTNGGATWLPRQSGTDAILNAVFLSNSQTAVALGTDSFYPPSSVVIKTTNAGLTWETFPTVDDNLYDMSFPDFNTGIAAGEFGAIYRTNDGGETWIKQSSEVINQLSGVSFSDFNNGLIVGEYGVILRTTNGGNTWSKQSLGTTNYLNGISFADSLNGTVVGTWGTILHTNDGGKSWLDQYAGPDYDYEGFNNICQIDTSIGTIVGDGGIILHTENGGLDWTRQNVGTNYSLYDVDFANLQYGFIVGGGSEFPNPDVGFILKTTNSGEAWTGQYGVIGILRGISVIDTSIAMAVGDGGTILRTTNGGIAWTAQISGTSSNLNDVSFVTSNIGTVVGNGGTILHTTDGGETWILQQSGVSNELTGVSFADADFGTAVGSYWAVILHTTNGGLNWTIQNAGTQTALTAVVQVNENFATVVGAWGTILHTNNGNVVFVDWGSNKEYNPNSFILYQNYPNPFNPSTRISWQSPVSSWQTLKVYDVLGNEVATLVNEYRQAGSYEIEFNPSSISHHPSSGVYFYRLQAGDYFETKKMILIR
jgi:photosystem II stability/assembly factor-like uncharacterized protein